MKEKLILESAPEEMNLDQLVKDRGYHSVQAEFLNNLIKQIIELKQGKSFAELEKEAAELKTMQEKKEMIERLKKLKRLLDLFENILGKKEIWEVNNKFLEKALETAEEVEDVKKKPFVFLEIARSQAKAGGNDYQDTMDLARDAFDEAISAEPPEKSFSLEYQSFRAKFLIREAEIYALVKDKSSLQKIKEEFSWAKEISVNEKNWQFFFNAAENSIDILLAELNFNNGETKLADEILQNVFSQGENLDKKDFIGKLPVDAEEIYENLFANLFEAFIKKSDLQNAEKTFIDFRAKTELNRRKIFLMKLKAEKEDPKEFQKNLVTGLDFCDEAIVLSRFYKRLYEEGDKSADEKFKKLYRKIFDGRNSPQERGRAAAILARSIPDSLKEEFYKEMEIFAEKIFLDADNFFAENSFGVLLSASRTYAEYSESFSNLAIALKILGKDNAKCLEYCKKYFELTNNLDERRLSLEFFQGFYLEGMFEQSKYFIEETLKDRQGRRYRDNDAWRERIRELIDAVEVLSWIDEKDPKIKEIIEKILKIKAGNLQDIAGMYCRLAFKKIF